MAEIEFSVLSRSCLKQRLSGEAALRREVDALVTERNAAKASINWRFNTRDARTKLHRLYPSDFTVDCVLAPYDIPPDAPAPGSVAESNELWRAVQAEVRSETVPGRFVTSTRWAVADDRFDSIWPRMLAACFWSTAPECTRCRCGPGSPGRWRSSQGIRSSTRVEVPELSKGSPVSPYGGK